MHVEKMNEPDSPSPQSGSERVHDVVALLSDEEYRHVIRYFRRESESVTDIDALVEYSVRLSDENVDRDSRAIALHHVVLPKLATAGVLDYDPRHNTVRYRGSSVAERLVS